LTQKRWSVSVSCDFLPDNQVHSAADIPKNRGESMNINVVFRHMETTEALKQYAIDKVSKIKKFQR